MSLIILTPKGPSLGGTTLFEPQSVNINRAVRAGRWSDEKKTVQDRKKSQKNYISPVWGEALTEAICIKNCVVSDVIDEIMRAKFQNEIFRVYDFTGGRSFHFPIDF